MSPRPLQTLYAVHQLCPDIQATGWHPKPDGLWFSPDTIDGWAAWSVNNEFWANEYTHLYEFLIDWDKMLLIRDAADVERVTLDYGLEYVPLTDGTYATMRVGTLPPEHQKQYLYGAMPAWGEIARKYCGIVIENFQALRWRLDLPVWVGGYDVDGGCIWHPDAIRSYKLLDSEYNKKKIESIWKEPEDELSEV